MAASTYERALAALLAHEGGYSNHPADPGGPTNFGITIADYRKYVKPGASAADVRAMKVEDARAIYRSKYWDAQRCDELPGGIDYAVFDYGVNSGIGRSGKVLRRMLALPGNGNAVTDTVVAAAAQADAEVLIVAICDERLRFLRSLRTWGVFGRGWSARVAQVKAFALQLASGVPAAAAPSVRASQSGKGAVPLNVTAQKGSAAAIAVAGAAAAQQAHRSGASPMLVAVIVIAAILLGVGCWTFWRRRQSRQQHAPA